MPVYMDVHEVGPDVTAADIAKAHARDLEVQGKYGVSYDKYFFNEKAGKIFCLCHAPSAEAAVKVHKEAHGLVADQLIEVDENMADLFMGAGEINSAGAAVLPAAQADNRDPGIRTILFTDIVGSTAMTRELGDEAAMELIHLHDQIVRDSLREHGGREIKHLGDGIMASFVSAVSAIKCASRVQREIAKHREENKSRPIKVRVGVAAGEPVEHHDDLFGCTVQLAARLCAHAQADQIVASNVVAELCEGKLLPFECLGEVDLKGFDHPVHVHAVNWAANEST
jgi:class 3 adenylate cyclase